MYGVFVSIRIERHKCGNLNSLGSALYRVHTAGNVEDRRIHDWLRVEQHPSENVIEDEDKVFGFLRASFRASESTNQDSLEFREVCSAAGFVDGAFCPLASSKMPTQISAGIVGHSSRSVAGLFRSGSG
jgi:hypothetical protein